MKRRAERLLALALRDVLAPLSVGDSIPDTVRWRDASVSLEFWWPSVYGWEQESLDGFQFVEAVKSAPNQVRLAGLALLIFDQAWTPCRSEIRVHSSRRRVDWYRLQLGQPGSDASGLVRAKYGTVAATQLLAAVTRSPPLTGWVFEASS